MYYGPLGRSTDCDFVSNAARGLAVSAARKDGPEKDAIAIMSDLGTNLRSNEAP
jgi:hypothetical protein